MQQFNYPLPSKWEAITQRPTASYDELEGLVSEVFKKVEAQGDLALLEYTAQFDQIQLQTVQVQAEEVTKAVAAVPEELKQAIQNAKTNI